MGERIDADPVPVDLGQTRRAGRLLVAIVRAAMSSDAAANLLKEERKAGWSFADGSSARSPRRSTPLTRRYGLQCVASPQPWACAMARYILCVEPFASTPAPR